MRRSIACALLPLLASCTGWFFSGEHERDLSHPVVLIETTGGIEFGASTEYGILFLGRTVRAEDQAVQSGRCRVHYLLADSPMIDDGEVEATGSVFARARIALRTQNVRVLDRPLTREDELVAMWTPDGTQIREVPVRLARHEGVAGDVLELPATELPIGATVLRRNERDRGDDFVGLIAGKATVDAGPAAGTYYVFAGVDRVRELLAVPVEHPVDLQPEYRPDGITVMKPVK